MHKSSDNYVDRSGLRYGNLIVLARAGKTQSGNAKWKYKYDCGNIGYRSNFISYKSKIPVSCGCLTQRNYIHGNSHKLRYRMFMSAKNRAKVRNLLFDLTIDDIPEIPEFCPVLGIKLEQPNGTNINTCPSLDRIVPQKGYIKGNVRIISFRANSLKYNATINELELILKDAKELDKSKNSC